MTPGILHGISDEQNIEKQVERQMGCMAGFLQLFDCHENIAGRRFYPAKRFPSSPATASPSPSDLSDVSSSFYVKAAPPSPENHPLEKPSLPLPEIKDGARTLWKLREAPRLSLDSRAVVDARGKLRAREVHALPTALPGGQSDCSKAGEDKNRSCRSPSVVARLMGLEALPDAEVDDQPKRPELRRSASESRVARDFPQFNFQKPSPISSNKLFRETKPEPPPASPAPLQRKSFFDAVELFPEPKHTGSIFSEIEKRLRMRGIDGSSKDRETLKHILEALQLKGLLRTKPPYQSPIVVMKPAAKPLHHRSVSPRRPEIIPPAKTLQNLGHRSLRSPISSPSPVRRQSASQPDRRIPTVHSPRASPRRPGSHQLGSRSPNDRRPKVETSSKGRVCSPAEDDDFSAFSDTSIFSSPANSDFESVRREEISRTGCNVLERCDQLLDSIAAITSSAEQVTAADEQPSPVSVLDSSFLSEESSAASPLLKRSIVFKDQLTDWDDDYGHVADVIRETDGYRVTTEQRHRLSKVSLLHRRLVFDIVTEIVGRKRNVTPWVAFTGGWASPPAVLLPEVWEEVRWLRETVIAENVIDLTGKMVRQDMAAGAAGEQEWAVPGVELSEAVLHIERQLFKDIVADTIRELADLDGRRRPTSLPRRKLIF